VRSPRRFPRGFALLVLLVVAACADGGPKPVAMQQDMPMGPFTLRAVSAEAYSRAHQGVPWQVDVVFEVSGGNRFDRVDLANRVSRAGVVFRTAEGWHERTWLLWRGEEVESFGLQANPPLGSRGYTVDIPNPYGKSEIYRLDLGM